MNKKTLIAALISMGLTAVSQAQLIDPSTVWAGAGTDVGVTLCYTVVSANSANGGTPVVTYLNATADNATNWIQFYQTSKAPAVCVNSNVTVQIPVASTNGFGAGNIVIIRHKLNDVYERRVVDTFTLATNINVTVAPSFTVQPGDFIYKCSTNGSIPVGAATKELNGSGIYSGQKGLPMLIEVNGALSCQLNSAAARYVNP